jgi:hypothetical protein
MSDNKNTLDLWVLEKIKKIDPKAYLSPASGAGNSLLDVVNKFFWIENKQKHTKENWIIDRKKDYLKSLKELPINSFKELIIVQENCYGEKMVCMEGEAFFRLIDKLEV